MTLRETVLAQLQHEETGRVPYTLGYEQDVADRLDEFFGDPSWRERIVPYIAHCGVMAIVRPPGAFSCVTDAFGTSWRTDKLPPTVIEPGLSVPSFEDYQFPTVDMLVDANAIDEAKRLAHENKDSFTIVGTGMCLWQSWYVRGFESTMMDCAMNEGFYTELLDHLTEITIEIINLCAEVPADAIMMGDDWGNQRGVMIGPDRWRKLYKPRYARIFEAVHRQNKTAIMHCCGSVADIMEDIVEIGLDVLESVQPEAAGMNPYELKSAFGDRITFWGGLGSQSTIPFSDAESVREEIRRLRGEMSRSGGYILAPAKPLRPETPTENAVAILEEFTR